MPRTAVLHARVDSVSAALVRVHAERAHVSTSERIAAILRRELSRTGAADALAFSSYEMLVTLGYILRALMIDAMGVEQAETAIQDASDTAADEAATALRIGEYVWHLRPRIPSLACEDAIAASDLLWDAPVRAAEWGCGRRV